jgi:hypothetical protein
MELDSVEKREVHQTKRAARALRLRFTPSQLSQLERRADMNEIRGLSANLADI